MGYKSIKLGSFQSKQANINGVKYLDKITKKSGKYMMKKANKLNEGQ